MKYPYLWERNFSENYAFKEIYIFKFRYVVALKFFLKPLRDDTFRIGEDEILENAKY